MAGGFKIRNSEFGIEDEGLTRYMECSSINAVLCRGEAWYINYGYEEKERQAGLDDAACCVDGVFGFHLCA